MKPEVDSVWMEDVVIRTLLIIAAILAASLLRLGWHISEMFAFGTVAAIMAWIGPKAWRPWTTPISARAVIQEEIARAWVCNNH